MRARIAAFTRASSADTRAGSAKARATFLDSFRARIDAQFPGLPEGEATRRAEALRRAYFAKLAFASAKARSKKVNAASLALDPAFVTETDSAPVVSDS
jgi:hypothetical protein